MKTVSTGGIKARARLSNTPRRTRVDYARIDSLEAALERLTSRVTELEKNPKVTYVTRDSGACE